MLSISQMETIRHQFDSFCRKVLREESSNLKMQYARSAEREVALSQLSEKQLQAFSTEDRYPFGHERQRDRRKAGYGETNGTAQADQHAVRTEKTIGDETG